MVIISIYPTIDTNIGRTVKRYQCYQIITIHKNNNYFKLHNLLLKHLSRLILNTDIKHFNIMICVTDYFKIITVRINVVEPIFNRMCG